MIYNGTNVNLWFNTLTNNGIYTGNLTVNGTATCYNVATSFFSGSSLSSSTGTGVLSSSDWISFNNVANNPHIIRVNSDGTGNFSSIVTAINSITGATESTPYKIVVGPGVFAESTINFKSWIWIEGEKDECTVIQTNSPNQHAVIGADNAGISKVTINGATGIGYAGVYYQSTGSSSEKGFYIYDARFGNNYICSLCDTTNGYTVLFNQNCRIGQQYTFTYGWICTGANPGRNVVIETTSTGGIPDPLPFEVFTCCGSQCEIIIQAVTIYASQLQPTGSLIDVFNGGTIRANSLVAKLFNVGLYVGDAGSGPTLDINSTSFVDCTQDIDIEHPETAGAFDGSCDVGKVKINASAPVAVVFADKGPSPVGQVILGNILQGSDFSKLMNLSKMTRAGTVGWISGGTVTNDGGLDVTVSYGDGFVISSVDSQIYEIPWSSTGITLVDGTSNYIYVAPVYNPTGAYGVVTSSTAQPVLDQVVYLGRAFAVSGSIEYVTSSIINMNQHGDRVESFQRDALGPIYVLGSTVTEDATPFSLDVTAGQYYYGTVLYSPSGASPITMNIRYRNGSGGWFYNNGTGVDNSHYDDGSGTLANISGSYYAKPSLYTVGEGVNETYILFYAQAQYEALAAAELAPLPTTSPDIINSVALIATPIVQQGASHIIEILDERPRVGFKTSGVTASADHTQLLNLNLNNAGHCLDAETELLTDKGFMKYADINTETVAATFNLCTGRIEYQKIKGKYVYDNFTKLVELKCKGHSILVTEEHRMVINRGKGEKYKIVEAKNLVGRTRKREYSIPCASHFVDNSNDPNKDVHILLGLIISQGRFNKNDKGETESIQLFQNDRQIFEYAKSLLENLGFGYTINRTKNICSYQAKSKIETTYCNRIRIRSKDTKCLLPYIQEKNISEYCSKLRGKAFKNLLCGLILGDGSINSSKDKNVNKFEIATNFENEFTTKYSYAYWSRDENLIDRLSILCTENGVKTLKRYKNGCWRSLISPRNSIIVTADFVSYSGSVWCVSVDNTTLVLRRKGQIFIAGNSQFMMLNGTTLMAGTLNMNNNSITGISTANGVTIETHESRHLPNGADPLVTSAPTTNLTPYSTNSVGIQNSLSRSDHSHAITGFQVTGNYISYLYGDVGATGPDGATGVVNSVGGSSAYNIHTAELLANSSTSYNVAGTIVRRDLTGGFSMGGLMASTGDFSDLLTVQAGITGSSGFFTSITGYNVYVSQLTGQSAFFTSTVTSSLATGSSAFFTSITGYNVFSPQITGQSAFFTSVTASIATGSSAFFTSITGYNVYASQLTGQSAFFTSITGTTSISSSNITGSYIYGNNLRRFYATSPLVKRSIGTWTLESSPQNNTWYSVCYASELRLLCAVSYGGTNRIMTSSDGINWVTQNAPSYGWGGICWSGDRKLFVACDNQDSSVYVMSSSDGVNWTPTQVGALDFLYCICYSPDLGQFCMLGHFGAGGSYSILSSNGTSWSGIYSIGTTNVFSSICWSPERQIFCAVGGTSVTAFSSNGQSWTSGTITGGGTYNSICWAPELGLFFACNGSSSIAISSDGSSWSLTTTPVNCYSVTWSPELQVAVCITIGSNICYSLNGSQWTSVSIPQNSTWTSICWARELGIFVAVNNNGTSRIMISSYSGFPPTFPNNLYVPQIMSATTITGTSAFFTTVTGYNAYMPQISGQSAFFTSITGAIMTGTSAFFTTVTGYNAYMPQISGQSAFFTSITGAIMTGTSAFFTTITGYNAYMPQISGQSAFFTSITGAIMTGTSAFFTTVTGYNAYMPQISGQSAFFTSITGAIMIGTSAFFTTVTGYNAYTPQISGQSAFFTSITGNNNDWDFGILYNSYWIQCLYASNIRAIRILYVNYRSNNDWDFGILYNNYWIQCLYASNIRAISILHVNHWYKFAFWIISYWFKRILHNSYWIQCLYASNIRAIRILYVNYRSNNDWDFGILYNNYWIQCLYASNIRAISILHVNHWYKFAFWIISYWFKRILHNCHRNNNLFQYINWVIIKFH